MQADRISNQLVKPTRSLLTGDRADTVFARDTGRTVGAEVFGIDDPDTLITAIFNMEAYFHSLREAALATLKNQLAHRYHGLAGIARSDSGIEAIMLNGGRRTVPVHTSPYLDEFVMSLDPADDSHDAGTCLKLVQQTVRLLEVLGLSQLSLRTAATGTG